MLGNVNKIRMSYAQSLEGFVLEGTETAKEMLLRYVTVMVSVYPRGYLVL